MNGGISGVETSNPVEDVIQQNGGSQRKQVKEEESECLARGKVKGFG